MKRLENGNLVTDDGILVELGEEAHEAACEAGHAWVDAVKERGGKMEDLDYPDFRQMLANANSPVWPTFDDPTDEETAIDAAHEYWCDTVNENRKA